MTHRELLKKSGDELRKQRQQLVDQMAADAVNTALAVEKMAAAMLGGDLDRLKVALEMATANPSVVIIAIAILAVDALDKVQATIDEVTGQN